MSKNVSDCQLKNSGYRARVRESRQRRLDESNKRLEFLRNGIKEGVTLEQIEAEKANIAWLEKLILRSSLAASRREHGCWRPSYNTDSRFN